MKRIFLIIMLLPCLGAAPALRRIPTPPVARSKAVKTTVPKATKVANFRIKVKNAPVTKKVKVSKSAPVTKSVKMPKVPLTTKVVSGLPGAKFPFPPHPPVVVPEKVVRVAPSFNGIGSYADYLRNKHSSRK